MLLCGRQRLTWSRGEDVLVVLDQASVFICVFVPVITGELFVITEVELLELLLHCIL